MSRPLKLVHVVRQYAPSIGGLESVVANVARLQRARLGYEVRVVTLDRLFDEPTVRLPRDETIDGVPVRRLPFTGSSRYPLCPQVLGEIRDADVVHVHAVDFFFDYLAATRWWHRKPMVASTHGGFFHSGFAPRLKKLWFRTITRATSRGYERLLASSDNDGATFGTIASLRTKVIELGVDVVRLRDASSRTLTRTILYFGRWSANKGLPDLLALFAAIRARDSAWKLIVAGRPYDLARADLEDCARTLSITDSVAFHESPNDEALSNLVGASSYFACLSSFEGFGLAAIEAMSAGLVPLLSDIPTFRKVVEQSGCGQLVAPPPRGDDDCAATFLALDASLRSSGNPQRAQAMRFSERYDWGHVVERYDAEYRAAIGRASTMTGIVERTAS